MVICPIKEPFEDTHFCLFFDCSAELNHSGFCSLQGSHATHLNQWVRLGSVLQKAASGTLLVYHTVIPGYVRR